MIFTLSALTIGAFNLQKADAKPVINTPTASICSNTSILGKYGTKFSGTTVSGSQTTPGPFAEVGLFTADGRGNLTGSDTVSVNGTIVNRKITGNYNVNEDCTLTVSLSDNFGLSVTFNGTIVDNGNEIFFIQSDEFSVVTGNGKKVSGN